MSKPDHTPAILTDELLNLSGLRHGFFTRHGGVSKGIYSGLNIGVGSSDDPVLVQQNRALAALKLGVSPDNLCTLYQIHSAHVVFVEAPFPPAQRPKADAMVTDRPGLALGIATADCAPVLFADPQASVIGACHAGWKGAFNGIVEATVLAMETLGAKRSDICAVLGPCIHQPSYEVGPEFRETFLEQSPDLESFFTPSRRETHFQFDLPAFVLNRMHLSRIASIGHIAEDTYAAPERFYSYRRATHREERDRSGAIDYGRLLSAITLTD